ncbi:MAG: RHS repeat-associated core domain-containing protein, partial [Vicinamibacterales bacterium]|nr:RHS repeat-associated core domain-containing protein [Vicinamibacterales bacterium]
AVQEGTALRHRYIGGVILEESGLYALGPRLYDPEVGRFLSPDPLVASPTNPQAFNRYSYALNNPVTLSDPSGLAPIYPGMEDPRGNSSSVDYYGPITHSTGSTRGPNYGNLARGCYADGRCPSQPQTPAISNPGSPTTQPYAANDVEGSQSVAAGELGPNVCPGACHYGQGFHPFRQSSPGYDEAAAVIGPLLPLVPIAATAAPIALPAAAEWGAASAQAARVAGQRALQRGAARAQELQTLARQGTAEAFKNPAGFGAAFSAGVGEGYNFGVPGGPRLLQTIPNAPPSVNLGLITGRLAGKGFRFIGTNNPF